MWPPLNWYSSRCWESGYGFLGLSYSHSLPFTSVQVEINMRNCTDLSPEPFKDKRFWGVVEIGGQLVESKNFYSFPWGERGKQEHPQPGWAIPEIPVGNSCRGWLCCGEIFLGLHLLRHQTLHQLARVHPSENRLQCFCCLYCQLGGRNKACFHPGRGYHRETTDGH